MEKIVEGGDRELFKIMNKNLTSLRRDMDIQFQEPEMFPNRIMQRRLH